jgi:hypothetical protein
VIWRQQDQITEIEATEIQTLSHHITISELIEKQNSLLDVLCIVLTETNVLYCMMNSRRPFHYHTDRRLAGDIDGLSAATYNRFQYYSKLRATAPEEDAALVSTFQS